MDTSCPYIQEQMPFASHWVQQGKWRQHVAETGEGPPVVMVHGNPTWSFFYRNLARAWSGSRRCLLPDHLGCGLSDKPQEYDYTLENHTRNLLRVLEARGLRRFSMVVHDWGGAIGLAAASRLPQGSLERLVILNTAAFHLPRLPRRIALCRGPRLGQWLVRRCNAFAGAAVYQTTVKRLPAVVRGGFLHPYGDWESRVAIHRFVADIPLEADHPSRPTLDALEAWLPQLREIPVRIHWGAKDWCFNDAFLARWKQLLPEAEVVVHEEAGHYLLEDAGETIAAQAGAFLGITPTTS